MPTLITQAPLYSPLPVGQDIIFTVANSLVTSYFNFKFIAEVYISGTTPPNTNVTTDLIGTFKAAPNNAGVGIFDFSAVIENHVKADNLMGMNSQYKSSFYNQPPFPSLHLVNKFSSNENTMKWMTIKFNVEGSITSTGIPEIISNNDQLSTNFKIFNGYLKHTDKLNIFNNEFGYDTSGFLLVNPTSKFLTNAPTTQYANVDDYGTVGLMPHILSAGFSLDYIKFTYYDTSGGVPTTDQVDLNLTPNYTTNVRFTFLYLGCYPANLRGWSSTFNALVTAGTIEGGYYTVQAFDSSNVGLSQPYTINVNCPDLRNYESIRLAWLNQWGAWDYYTFTKKSTRSLSTQGSTYTQLEGTWNERLFRLNGYRGGKKSFRVNATEKIKMNTNFVSESESEWFEELINSPAVYMLEGFQGDTAFALLNTYATPVRLTTSSYTRKTIANDKLIQYSFEVEKSKTLRTQAI